MLLIFPPSYVERYQMFSGNQSRLYLNSCSFSCSPHILPFNVCETPQHFLHLLLAPSDSFVQFLSIFLLDSNVRWAFRWSMLSFLGVVTILFSAVRGPLLSPSSCLCSLCIILFSNHHRCPMSSWGCLLSTAV